MIRGVCNDRTPGANDLGVMAKWQTKLYRIMACRLNLEMRIPAATASHDGHSHQDS
jgi:hypothetical protein